MSNLNESNRLSAEDLKIQLFQSMQSTGVLKQLKGQLRQSMINELRGKKAKKKGHNQPSDLLAATIKQRKTHTWIQRAIDNLVYLHLKQNRYQYSLSLFQQESSIESYSPSLAEDLLERLGLQASDIDVAAETPGSSLSEDFPQCSSTPTRSNSQPPILWRILEKLSNGLVSQPFEEKENTNFVSKKEEKPLTLGEKLKAIDDEMRLKPKPKTQDPTIAVSSYATAVRRAEEDADRRSRVALEQWKAVDLTRMKMEEAKKAKEAIDSRMKELEKDYQLKRDALQARERAAVSRMSNQREMLEKEMHDQRQALLREIDQMRMREDTLQKQEQLIHELEKTKHKELSILKDQLESSHGLRKDALSTATIYRSKCKIEELPDLQIVHQQLEEKSRDICCLKKEIEVLKADLSGAHLQRQSQTERENLLLKSHLDQLSREVEGYKAGVGSDRSCKINVEEKLRQQLEILKHDKAEEEAQRRQLAETLKVMQVALEDSNKALINLNSQQKQVSFAQVDGNNESGTLEKLMSSYSPPQKADSLRNYEPVDSRIQLHPDISSSDDFDDASINDRMASSGIGLDVRYRLKDLQTETDKASEQYQRYINTHYRDAMEARSKSRTGNSHNLDQAGHPVHSYSGIVTDRFSVQPLAASSWPTGSQRPVEPREQIVLADEVSLSSHEIPPLSPRRQSIPSEHSSPSLSLSSDKTNEQVPLKDSSVFVARQPNAVSSNSRETANFELRISMDSLEQNPESEPSSSSKSSGGSRSPQIDTVRRVEHVEQRSKDLDRSEDIPFTVERKLPPLAAPRQLPSLPPIEGASHLSQPSPLSPTALSAAAISSSHLRHPEKNASCDEGGTSESYPLSPNGVIGTPGQSDHRVVVDVTVSDSTSSSTSFVVGDKENMKPTYRSAIDFQEDLKEFENQENFAYVPSHSNNSASSKPPVIDHPVSLNPQAPLEDDNGRRVSDNHDLASSVSSVSEEILSAFSSSIDSRPPLPASNEAAQKETNDDVSLPIASKFSGRCSCSGCVAVKEQSEAVCCHEIETERMKTMLEEVSCITQHPGFEGVCFNPWKLETAHMAYTQQYNTATQHTTQHSLPGYKEPNELPHADSYSSEFTTEDESVTEESLDKPRPEKTLADFNLSDDNDISAALRWEDKHRPSLDFDEEDVVKKMQEPAGKDEEYPHEEVDVFETSDAVLSLDSTPGGNVDLRGNNSDDSW